MTPRSPVVVTIDGPAGSGKSTTAGAVAERLGFRHLDSGALYRALTLGLVRGGVPEEEWPGLDEAAFKRLDLRLEPMLAGFLVLLDGAHPGAELRSPDVTGRVSMLARIPAARTRLLQLQRSAPDFGDVVADGRDMGTVVFPEASLKVFLTATLEARATRRLRQEGEPENPGTLSAESARILERDTRDEGRTVAPLRRPVGALVIDTTDLSFQAQVDRIVEAARATLGR